MEMWPRLVDWNTFQEKYKPGLEPNEWSIEPDIAHPCDSGSMNVGTVDAFRLMEAHLPDDVREALSFHHALPRQSAQKIPLLRLPNLAE
jgi:hypothetical protein